MKRLALVLIFAGCGQSIDYEGVPQLPMAMAMPTQLAWNTPITSDSLRMEVIPSLQGKSLGDIISSRVSVRSDGKTCLDCHRLGSGSRYQVPEGDISPTEGFAGRAWVGEDGWAQLFLAEDGQQHAAGLTDCLTRWYLDGERATERLSWTLPITERNLAPGNPLIGLSLMEIVDSEVVVRDDGLLCVDCHYRGGDISYRPVDDPIDGDTIIDGATWRSGWATAFLTHDEQDETVKPKALRDALRKWLLDGAY